MYILLAVVLMSMDQRGQYVPQIRGTMELALEPAFRLVGWPTRAWQSLSQQTTARSELISNNRQLHQELLKTAGSMQTLAALEQENQRLRKLLDATQGRAYKFTFAEMIQVDLDPFSHKVWIDHGNQQGIISGQAVIDGLGIVGQVERVFSKSSIVRLISDPDHALPVQINRTGLRSVAFGTGETGHLIMPNVPQQADISAGDVIVTSGLGDRFPPGFPVGEVEKVERESGKSFARAYIRPYAALDRGREVLVVEPYFPGGLQDEFQDEFQGELQDEFQDDLKNGFQNRSQDEPQDELQEGPQNEPQDEPQNEPQNEPQDELQEIILP